MYFFTYYNHLELNFPLECIINIQQIICKHMDIFLHLEYVKNLKEELTCQLVCGSAHL